MIFIDVYDETEVQKFSNAAKLEYSMLDPSCIDKYLASLVLHIQSVKEAGEELGVDSLQLVYHDQSKFTPNEFPFYAKHFHGGGSPNGFALAWIHHMHHNPHHWQHWIFPDGFTPKGSDAENGVLEMPNNYLLEMVADWMGAEKTYGGSWDMTNWLHKNMPRIRLHTKTAESLRNLLDMLGYADTVFVQRFAHEINGE